MSAEEDKKMKKLLKKILTKIYVTLIGEEIECYSTVITRKGKVYVLTVEEYHSTYELVEELKKRVGVEVYQAEPYEDKEVKVNGPAQILVVVD